MLKQTNQNLNTLGHDIYKGPQGSSFSWQLFLCSGSDSRKTLTKTAVPLLFYTKKCAKNCNNGCVSLDFVEVIFHAEFFYGLIKQSFKSASGLYVIFRKVFH